MTSARQTFVLLVAVAVTVAGVWRVLELRLAQGDVYPPYSSHRADPLGTRAWHDALERLPGFTVTRHLRPISKLAAAPARTVVLAGAGRWIGEPMDHEVAAALQGVAEQGGRLVIALAGEPARARDDSGAEQEESNAPDGGVDRVGRGRSRTPLARLEHELTRTWGFQVKQRWLFDRGEGARRAADAPEGLPEALTSRSDWHFQPAAGQPWRVLYRRAGQPVVMERPLGRGSVVLMADSYPLSNEALHREPAVGLLAWLAGPHAHVEFSEGHLGVVADPGIGPLARRYGLGGALAVALLLAALYVWRAATPLVPPPARESIAGGAEVAIAAEPGSGLAGLLRRAVPASGLVAACVEEWRKSRRHRAPAPGEARLEQAWSAGGAAQLPPAAAYNRLRRELQPR